MFKDKLKELRKKSKLTQSELGEKLGVSASIIGMYEQGRRTPTVDGMIGIANFFDVPLGYLLYGVDELDSSKHPDFEGVLDYGTSEGMLHAMIAVSEFIETGYESMALRDYVNHHTFDKLKNSGASLWDEDFLANYKITYDIILAAIIQLYKDNPIVNPETK